MGFVVSRRDNLTVFKFDKCASDKEIVSILIDALRFARRNEVLELDIYMRDAEFKEYARYYPPMD